MSEMYALEMSEATLVKTMHFGKGEVFTQPHNCDDPAHAVPQVVKVLCILIKDAEDKDITLVFPADSPLAQAFTEMDIYYHIRSLLEIDN